MEFAAFFAVFEREGIDWLMLVAYVIAGALTQILLGKAMDVTGKLKGKLARMKFNTFDLICTQRVRFARDFFLFSFRMPFYDSENFKKRVRTPFSF